MLQLFLLSLGFTASLSVTCDECWDEYSNCEWNAQSAAYDECSHIWEEGSQHPAFNQQCIEQQAVDQVECYESAGCFEPGNQDCWWKLWEFGCSPYQCETYTICTQEFINQQGCGQQLDSCSETCQQPEWEYVYEEIPECIRNNCGEIIQQCATSDACVEGIEGIANSCYNGQVNPEECMDATFIQDAEDTPSALSLCGGDETCATDLQQIGECVINSQCLEEENQEKFKKLQTAMRFRKLQKQNELKRKNAAERKQRRSRPRPAPRGRSRRKLLSSGCCECTSAKGSPFCNSECDSYICPLDGYCCNNQWDWICADAAQNVCYGEDGYGSSSYDSYDPYNYGSSDYSSYDSGYDSYYSPYDSYDPYGSSSYDSYYSPSSDYYSSYDPYSSDYNSYTPGSYYNPSSDYYGSSGYNSYQPPKGRRVRARGRVQRRPRPAARRRQRTARRARPAARTRSRRKLLSSGCCECTSSKGSPFCNSECDAQMCPLDSYCCNNQWDWICADAAQNVCYGEDAYGSSSSYDSYDPYSYPSSDYSSYNPYDSYYSPSFDYYSSYDPYDSYYNPSSDYSSYDPYGYDSYGSDYGYSSYQPPKGRRVRPRFRAQTRQRRARRVRPKSAVRGERSRRARPATKRRERRKLTESSGCCECTESKNTPFCNSECENEICPLDPYCCNNQWDWICADASANVCNGEEAYGSTWNSYGSYTPNDYGSDNSGSCCDCQSSKGSPYCNSECDSQLCPLDPYCCNNSWDWICANSATDVCYEEDNYGDGYSSYNSYPSYDYSSYDYPSYDYSSYDSYGYPSYDYSSYDPYGYSSYDSYGYPSYDYSSYDPYGYSSYDPYGYSSYDSYGYPSYDYSSYDSYGYPSYDYSSYDSYGYPNYDYSSYDSYDPYGYSSDYYGSDSYNPNSYSACGEIPDIPECIATNCCSYLLECSGDSQCVSAVEGIGEECGHEDESEIAQCVEDVFINDVEQTKVYELCAGDQLCVTSFTALGQCAFSNCFSTNAGYLVKSLKNSLESLRTKKANKLKKYNKIKSVKQQRAKSQLNARRQFSKNKQLKRVQQQQFNQQRRKYVNKRREFNARMKAKRAEKVKA